MAEGEAAEALRRLVGQLQELCDLYGSPPFFSQDQFHRIDPSSLDLKPDPNPKPYFLNSNSKEKDESESESQSSSPHKRPRTKTPDSISQPQSQTQELESQDLDSRIWTHLLEDLFHPILARLPIPSIFRFQSVCSQWRSIVKSEAFNDEFLRVPKSHTWLYTVTHEDSANGSVYDPVSKKWHHPKIPFLNEDINGSKMGLPVASAGGLICFLDLGKMDFYVSNPLTKNYKKLPNVALPFWSRVSVGMVGFEKGYKIICLCCDGKYEVYDSIENKWIGNSVPAGIELPLDLNFRSRVISIGKTLYFMRGQPDGILTYNFVTGIWKQYTIPLPVHLKDSTLAELRGRILLVGLLSKNCANCVGVWELQRMTLLWKEVDRMPSESCLELYGKKRLQMNCVGSEKGLVFLSLRSEKLNCLVCYDAEEREWVKVPECGNGLVGKKGRWVLCGTGFEPSPCALP
ncbi:hypothetical protein LUZ60_002058 [Juncus effusus]|nr:hypothetical protein LUZ60_002058 [Juncus effusus]